MPLKSPSPLQKDPTDEPRAGGSFRERDVLDNLHRYTDEEYKTRWFAAPEFHTGDSTLYVDWSSIGGIGAWIFFQKVPAQFGGVLTSLCRPRQWINGKLKIEYYFTTNVAGAGDDILMRYRVSSWSAGDIVGAVFDILDLARTETITNAANELFIVTVETTSNVLDTDDILGFEIERNSGDAQDTYSDNVRFHGLRITYLPENRQ